MSILGDVVPNWVKSVRMIPVYRFVLRCFDDKDADKEASDVQASDEASDVQASDNVIVYETRAEPWERFDGEYIENFTEEWTTAGNKDDAEEEEEEASIATKELMTKWKEIMSQLLRHIFWKVDHSIGEFRMVERIDIILEISYRDESGTERKTLTPRFQFPLSHLEGCEEYLFRPDEDADYSDVSGRVYDFQDSIESVLSSLYNMVVVFHR